MSVPFFLVFLPHDPLIFPSPPFYIQKGFAGGTSLVEPFLWMFDTILALYTSPAFCPYRETVDGCEILRQLKTVANPIILFGFQPSKVVQDFFHPPYDSHSS